MGASDERQVRIDLCEIARDIWTRGLGAAGDGNLSVRVGPNRVLTTPTAKHKGRLRPRDIVAVDLAGRPLGPGRPSSEIAMHVKAYELRDDITAVIHAHPPMATAFELAGGKLSELLVSEVVFSFGQVATAPYTTPTTAEVAATLGPYLRCYDVVMMPRHGVVTLGSDLDEAFMRLDSMEHTARVCATAHLLGARFSGPPAALSTAEVGRLYEAANTPRVAICAAEGTACPPLELSDRSDRLGETLAEGVGERPGEDERLVAAVIAALSGGSSA